MRYTVQLRREVIQDAEIIVEAPNEAEALNIADLQTVRGSDWVNVSEKEEIVSIGNPYDQDVEYEDDVFDDEGEDEDEYDDDYGEYDEDEEDEEE